jgi:tetratricopeptide (TPR) repeat protein
MAQDKLSECENPPTPIAPGKKPKKAKVKQSDCTSLRTVVGISLGNYRDGFSDADSYVRKMEDNLARGWDISQYASSTYQQRALYEYALGNPVPALRDLQNALDWYRRAPGVDEEYTYFYRAIILADMGNNEAARQDCMTALSYKFFGNLPFQKEFCTRLTAAPAAFNGSQAGSNVNASEDSHRADEAIGRIRAGRYAPMPAAQASAGSAVGSPRLTIENATQYELHVYVSGPQARSFSIQAGASTVVDLAAGTFRLAAEIPNSSVLPFYGEQTFNNGTAYVERFYVRVQ